MLKKILCLSFVGLIFSSEVWSQEDVGYQMPPASIAELVDAPNVPKTMLNDQHTWMLLLRAPRYVDLEMAAHPILGLAGLRINPETRTLAGEHHGFFTQIELTNLENGTRKAVLSGLPTDLKMSHIQWHPDGDGFAFTHQLATGLELWYADLRTLSAKRLSTHRLNGLIGQPIQWHPKGAYILAQFPAHDDRALPTKPRMPHGPVIQENLGKRTPNRTFSNLLENAYDEELFDYYVESQLTKVYLDGRTEQVGKASIFKRQSFSADGQFLLVETVQKPYSYLVGVHSFPSEIAIWDTEGQLLKALSSSADTTSNKPRSFRWRPDHPNELVWAQSFSRSQDTSYRDGIYGLSAPFQGQERMIFRTELSFSDIVWGHDHLAIVKESQRRTRELRWTLIDPSSGESIRVIEERSTEDSYADPGDFILRDGVLLLTGSKRQPIVHTIGNGASPQGERPFLLRWNLTNNKRDTLFKSPLDRYELPIDFDGEQKLFFTRETWNIPPNLIQLNLKNQRETPLTQIGALYPSLSGVSKSLMNYMRRDSVKLTGTLYLPADFQPGISEPLPVLVWAYPREYKSAELASQVRGSSHKFTELNFRSAVYWVTRGYAVVDMADMPIIGEGKEEPNDTFVEQLIWNSEALIDHMVDAGIADRDRFGVGGHSYGAFMTANLLAHSDLFAAGIARSGAYNRTLTPFGFQSESRTYWKAKDVYDRMSPFTYADKIKLPLLITHGIDDENSGTFPVQSERLYAAIKGHGGTVRLVMFPHEFHGFRSRESIMHVFWEQDRWIEEYVKNRPVKTEKKEKEDQLVQ